MDWINKDPAVSPTVQSAVLKIRDQHAAIKLAAADRDARHEPALTRRSALTRRIPLVRQPERRLRRPGALGAKGVRRGRPADSAARRAGHQRTAGLVKSVPEMMTGREISFSRYSMLTSSMRNGIRFLLSSITMNVRVTFCGDVL